MTIQTQRMQLPGLNGLRVAITAGGEIGMAIARELKGQGARLAICDVDASALERASKGLGAEVEDLPKCIVGIEACLSAHCQPHAAKVGF